MRLSGRPTDVESATLRYLLFGLLPAWFAPGILDWLQHRRTRIEHTSGTRESLIHALMMAEVGGPIALALLCEINPLALVIIASAIAAHEATALWDVRTAQDSGRTVTPWEQHVHSFLESLPFMATGTLACLHWEQLRALAGGATQGNAWRLRFKRRRLPTGYLAAVGGAIAGLIALPYGEELYRCLRSRRPAAPPDAPALA
ncbi:diguanylate cyclase/phosphodiesterase [Amycolatopsis alkalitolerans]|uniref:Diguanylate cyclase/phosphodiesterase n=1 Tax=Amycolatopsis alkalitolerans TaxID=2547244 RepID=A0A5C4LZT2_9PSEU|nr:diguanylate cyclase/phosphodiesterase [Amycolatopsis alkalitolerans]